MTKSLLQQIMVKKEVAPAHPMDVDGLTEMIKSGYTVNRIDKHAQKKTFAPSTIASAASSSVASKTLVKIH